MDLSNENVIHIKKDGIDFLQFRKLLEYKEITHAYTLGLDKNFRTAKANMVELDKKEYDKAIDDYKNICREIGTDYTKVVKANQNHTDEVKVIDKKININKPDINLKEYKDTDGFITNKKGLVLSTTNADCILLLFYDPVKKVIGNSHSGWKGTLKRISVKTVDKMQKEYGCNPKDIICCIAPSIRKCHFEVEKDVKDMFEKEFYKEIENAKDKSEIIKETVKNKKWKIDTVELNKIILQNKGLDQKNIIDSGICSVCNKNIIHSFRAEGNSYGLNTALIEIKE